MSRREFTFVEGSSSKFWAIELAGKSHTVHYGRIGTAGQAQTKEFPSDADAKSSYDKLIAEKVKKGYVENTGGGAAPAAVPTPKAKPAAKPAETPAEKKPEPKPSAPAETVAVTVAVAASSEPVKIDLDIVRRIDLDPRDWHMATWRPRTVLQKPAAKPFDLNDCAARLAKISRLDRWSLDWIAAGVSISMTPEEASFWLLAMAETVGLDPGGPAFAEAIVQKHQRDPEPIRNFGKAQTLFAAAYPKAGTALILPMINLLPLEKVVDLLLNFASNRKSYMSPNALQGFEEFVLPCLSNDQIRQVRDRVIPPLKPALWPTDPYKSPPVVFFMAAMVGAHDQMAALVTGWPDDFYAKGHYVRQPQRMVLGLGDPKLMESQMRRLKVPLDDPYYVRGWLAHTEYSALDYVCESLLTAKNKEECGKWMEVLALVKAPENAGPMLQLRMESRAPQAAQAWLEENSVMAIAGLIGVAGGRGKVADAAIDFLKNAKAQDRESIIRKFAGSAPPERVRKEVLDVTTKTYAALDEKTTPAEMKSAMADVPNVKLPGFANPAILPPIVVGEHRLNETQILAVLAALQKGDFSKPHALFKELKAHADSESLDAFTWRLFDLWVTDGAASKDKWAMGAIGLLGSDALAMKITPLIRNWPGESQHQRAVFGLECLRAIGSDTALMCLNGIAQKLKFKGLKARALELMDLIASDRGMSRSDLEDRIVPDCDLDERGSRIFDFGPRQFRFVLGPEMKPMVKDADGKVKSDLPAPNSKDDAAKATEAVEAWKLMKKQVKELAKIQAERLEQVMVTGRQWTPKEFEQLLVKHPLMINLVRLLLWGEYDDNQKLVATFRVTEDQGYADPKDDAYKLTGENRIGIVHAMHLTEAQKNAWGQIFGDYEIVAPFEQIGRPVYNLEKGEADQTDITRFAGKKNIPATALVGTLERQAWTRGIPEDGGVFHEHSKPFPGANVTAVVQYEGVPAGYMEGWEDQEIERTFFVPGMFKPDTYPNHKNRIKLKDVDPIAVSEVLKDLTLIASKAKT